MDVLWWLNIGQLLHELSLSISCNSKTKFHYEPQTYIHSYWHKVTKKLFKIICMICIMGHVSLVSLTAHWKMTWLNFHTFQYFIIIQKTFKRTHVFQRRPEILLKSKVNHEWFSFYLLYITVKTIFVKPWKIT